MAFCRSCAAEVGDAKYCPQCGSPVAPPTYLNAEERGIGISKKRSDILGILLLLAVVSSVIALLIALGYEQASENTNDVPPPTHGELAFHIHNEYISTRFFKVYLKGEGVPSPNLLGWDFTSCNDDHVYCACIWGECGIWGRTAWLDPDSYFLMEIDLPFGSYDYEIEVGSTVIASGSVYLTEDDYRETESFYYYG